MKSSPPREISSLCPQPASHPQHTAMRILIYAVMIGVASSSLADPQGQFTAGASIRFPAEDDSQTKGPYKLPQGLQYFATGPAASQTLLQLYQGGVGNNPHPIYIQGQAAQSDNAASQHYQPQDNQHLSVNYPQQSQASPNYPQQSQVSPNYPQQSQVSPNYPQQSQVSPNYPQQSQVSPNYPQQSHSPPNYPKPSHSTPTYPPKPVSPQHIDITYPTPKHHFRSSPPPMKAQTYGPPKVHVSTLRRKPVYSHMPRPTASKYAASNNQIQASASSYAPTIYGRQPYGAVHQNKLQYPQSPGLTKAVFHSKPIDYNTITESMMENFIRNRHRNPAAVKFEHAAEHGYHAGADYQGQGHGADYQGHGAEYQGHGADYQGHGADYQGHAADYHGQGGEHHHHHHRPQQGGGFGLAQGVEGFMDGVKSAFFGHLFGTEKSDAEVAGSSHDAVHHKKAVVMYKGQRPPVSVYQKPQLTATKKHPGQYLRRPADSLAGGRSVTPTYSPAGSSWQPINAPVGAVPARSYDIQAPDLSRNDQAQSASQGSSSFPDHSAQESNSYPREPTGTHSFPRRAQMTEHRVVEGAEEVVSAVVLVKQ